MMRFVNEQDFGQIRKKFYSELQEDLPFRITQAVSGMVAKKSQFWTCKYETIIQITQWQYEEVYVFMHTLEG